MSRNGKINGLTRVEILAAELADAVRKIKALEDGNREKDRHASLITQVACVLMMRLGKDRLVMGEPDLRAALLHCGMRLGLKFVPAEDGKGQQCEVLLDLLDPMERLAQEDAVERARVMAEAEQAAGGKPPPEPPPEPPTLRVVRDD